jgi:hypothetical protein
MARALIKANCASGAAIQVDQIAFVGRRFSDGSFRACREAIVAIETIAT